MEQHTTEPRELSLNVTSGPNDVSGISEKFGEWAREQGWSDRAVFGLQLAVEEAVVNAAKHGNSYDKDKRVIVLGRCCDDGSLEVRVMDEGNGVDPQDIPDPTDVENLERQSGRGTLLMKHYATFVDYKRPDQEKGEWHTVTLRFCDVRQKCLKLLEQEA